MVVCGEMFLVILSDIKVNRLPSTIGFKSENAGAIEDYFRANELRVPGVLGVNFNGVRNLRFLPCRSGPATVRKEVHRHSVNGSAAVNR